MNRSTLVFAFVIAGGLILSVGNAQVRVTTVSADMGYIWNLLEHSDDKLSVCPEVMVGGPLFEDILHWGLYWGYWDDGIDELIGWADYITYSYSSHIVGIRVIHSHKMLPVQPITTHLIVGVSHHFIDVEYVGGYGIGGEPGQDFSDDITTAELGLRTAVTLSDLFRLRLEAVGYLPFGDHDRNGEYGVGASLRLGFDYSFR